MQSYFGLYLLFCDDSMLPTLNLRAGLLTKRRYKNKDILVNMLVSLDRSQSTDRQKQVEQTNPYLRFTILKRCGWVKMIYISSRNTLDMRVYFSRRPDTKP